MKLSVRVCQRSLLLFATCVAIVFQLYSLPVSLAAPAPRLGPISYVTSQSTDVASASNQLKTIVQQAVNNSVSALGMNTTLNNNITCELVNNIITNLLSAGIDTPLQCRPKPTEDLIQHFLSGNAGFSQGFNACLGLDQLMVPELGEKIYFVATNSSCRKDIRIDADCYGAITQENQCSMGTELRPIAADLGKNYFPRYMVQMTCEGCSEHDTQCRERHGSCYAKKQVNQFHLLKRITDRCDSNGYEKWVLDRPLRSATVACSCQQE